MTSSFDPVAERGVPGARAALWIAIAFLLAVTAVAGVALERERRLLLAQARDDARTLAALFEENTARTFDAVDTTLLGISAYVAARQAQRYDPDTRETMRARLQFMPTVRALFVIGADGFIQHDTDYPKTPDISLADRGYFRQYLQDPRLERAVSEPLQSRSGTGWFVASTRRVTGHDGRFLGVAVAAVQLDSISRLYRKMDLQEGQQVALLRLDGTLLARYPADDSLIGRNFAELPIFSRKLLQERAQTFETSGPPLGFERIVSYRKLDSQPLVVIVSTSMEAVLAPWKRALAGTAAALFLLALLTAAAVLYFGRHQRERMRRRQHQADAAAALEVAQANAKFRAFFEQGSLFACVLDPSGDVLEVNHGGRDAGEAAAETVLRRKFWACDWWSRPASQVATLREGFARALAGTTFRTEAAFQATGAESRLVELALSPVRSPDGSVLAVAAVGIDITDRKSQEERLRVLASDLSDADRRRSEFLATLSHELRNVLTPVQNCAQIMKMVDPSSEQAARAREIISQQLVQMKRLVDDLLDVSRINSGKVDLRLEPGDLRGVLTQACAAARTFMERGGHEFDIHLPDEELPVVGDTARLQQVFTNLLSNAAKYTPPGGHVWLRARREGHEAIIEIADTGLGIPIEAQAKVFEMFEQVGSHAERRQGGLGIGLALVSKLVSLHGGHVEVSSDGPGRGSTFTVFLPLAGSPAAPRVNGSQPAGQLGNG